MSNNLVTTMTTHCVCYRSDGSGKHASDQQFQSIGERRREFQWRLLDQGRLRTDSHHVHLSTGVRCRRLP